MGPFQHFSHLPNAINALWVISAKLASRQGRSLDSERRSTYAACDSGLSIILNASRTYIDNQNQQAGGQVKEITYVMDDPRLAVQRLF